MAEMLTVKSVRDKLGLLWRSVRDNSPGEDASEATNQAFQSLSEIVDRASRGDAVAITTMAKKMSWVFAELDPIVNGLRSAAAAAAAAPAAAPNSPAHPSIVTYQKKIQLIRCKVQYHVE